MKLKVVSIFATVSSSKHTRLWVSFCRSISVFLYRFLHEFLFRLFRAFEFDLGWFFSLKFVQPLLLIKQHFSRKHCNNSYSSIRKNVLQCFAWFCFLGLMFIISFRCMILFFSSFKFWIANVFLLFRNEILLAIFVRCLLLYDNSVYPIPFSVYVLWCLILGGFVNLMFKMDLYAVW